MSPKSGRIYERLMEKVAKDRIVIAPDYPGSGESDPPPAEPQVTIEDYAASMWEVVDALDLGSVDILGYHTGSEVAAEAARQRPEQVGNIVMISAPVFTADELAEIQRTYKSIPLDMEGTRFGKMWASVLRHRGPGMTLEMAAASFAENLRAGENYEWGHRAAFQFAPRYAEIVQELPYRITVINPQDDLVEQTLRIIPFLSNGKVINHPEWGHGFLDAHTDSAVEVILQALNE
jgi:pimeloyl-ACP methyl ester carboxylesterase